MFHYTKAQSSIKIDIMGLMRAWIFDVDGVLTNLALMDINRKEIPDKISQILSKEPVALVTGRSLSWVRNRILQKLSLTNKAQANLFIAAEFGLVTASYQNDSLVDHVDENLKTPQEVIEKASEIINKYSGFYEIEDKVTIFTAKTRRNIPRDKLEMVRAQAMKELKTFLQQTNYEALEGHGDTSAVNVRNKRANKSYATKKVLEWLRSKNINPGLFLVFGDSDSDFEIGEELKNQSKNFKFIYVGQAPARIPSFPLIRTAAKNDEGTLEYLKTH